MVCLFPKPLIPMIRLLKNHSSMILFFDFLKESIKNLIHQLRLIRVGIMPRIFQPVDRDPRPLVPRLVVTDAGAGMVFSPADQQRRALQPIRLVRFHGLRQNAEPMS